MSSMCPIECVRAACPDPDFVEKNGTWLLTVFGIGTGLIGSVLAYMLKSRCSKIKCCGLECDRTVMDPKDYPAEPTEISTERA